MLGGLGIAEDVGGETHELARKCLHPESLRALNDRKRVLSIFKVFGFNGVMRGSAFF